MYKYFLVSLTRTKDNLVETCYSQGKGPIWNHLNEPKHTHTHTLVWWWKWEKYNLSLFATAAAATAASAEWSPPLRGVSSTGKFDFMCSTCCVASRPSALAKRSEPPSRTPKARHSSESWTDTGTSNVLPRVSRKLHHLEILKGSVSTTMRCVRVTLMDCVRRGQSNFLPVCMCVLRFNRF